MLNDQHGAENIVIPLDYGKDVSEVFQFKGSN